MHAYITRQLTYEAAHPPLRRFITELFAFGYKNALSCLFPVFIFGMLWLSKMLWSFEFMDIPGLYRYDVLLLACLAMQAVMYFTGLETKDEVLVITVFHILGLVMEIHKVHHNSWSYPEEGWTKVGGVPLYSGFMYASVASYICQGWRRLDLKLVYWPKIWIAAPLGAAIYLNFFTNAFILDVRWYIVPLLFIAFFRTRVYFNNNGPVRQMPMLLAFFLIGLFIWFAENIATFFDAWKYSYQHAGWQAVHIQKLSSWSLLVIVSIIIVAYLKKVKDGKEAVTTSAG